VAIVDVSLVVDASVVLRLLLHTGATGSTVRAAVAGQDLHSPHLLDVDVAAGSRRLVAARKVTAGRAAAALSDLAALGLDRYPHAHLLSRIRRLRANLSAYDACYAALAEALQCQLLTSDHRLATAPGPRCARQHLP
jgi:predicted nucleic acid-binding protein